MQANRTHENSMTSAPTGWHVIYPDGGSWIAVHLDHSGRMTASIEEANASTHITAGDSLAPVSQAIKDDHTNPDITLEHAANVVAAWDEELDPDQCTVERIVGFD
jgi:hypothetical protein